MKKKLLATIIAAALSTNAHAASTITSSITGVQLWLGFTEANAQILDPLVFGGTDDGNITFSGEISLLLGYDMRLTFDLQSGNDDNGNGLVFDAGTIVLWATTAAGANDWRQSGIVNLGPATETFSFESSPYGHVGAGPQHVAGVQYTPYTTTVLPGLWNGAFRGPGWNNAVSNTVLLGSSSGLFLEGIIYPAVPVPAAAWLFGSALLGLSGIMRKKKSL